MVLFVSYALELLDVFCVILQPIAVFAFQAIILIINYVKFVRLRVVKFVMLPNQLNAFLALLFTIN